MDLMQYRDLAERIFGDIREMSFDGVGITRESYGRGESAAADYLTRLAEAEGLAVEVDRAANLVFSPPDLPAEAPAVWVGSHIDSVPQGGNYDGLAGVVAGLLCLIASRREAGGKRGAGKGSSGEGAPERASGSGPSGNGPSGNGSSGNGPSGNGPSGNGPSGPPPLRVVAFRGEESAWFGKAYMGSSALLGKLSPADLELTHRSTGDTLAQYMERTGADVDAIRAQEVLVDLGRIRAYLELHIEQGPVMVARGLPVAVVSGIRGNIRHNRIECLGDAQHSGVVPRWLRHDAMFAVADLIMRLDEHWRVLLERGTDLVVTAGIVQTDPAEHSISRIPGRVGFSFEARSKSTDTLEAFYQLMRAECSAISRERGVKFEFDRRVFSEPATMDPRICDILSKACEERGAPYEVIPSGAGHDASLFANAGIPSGMLFVRNQNGSHNPHEAMEIDDFMLGVQVLADALYPLFRGPL